jgi:uncharacterized SAM-binding protein YcdF (DUF218 family)
MLLTLATAVTAGMGAVGVLAFRVDAFARSRPAPGMSAAIVVLGARVLPNGRAAPALQRRAEKGAELYRRGLAPLVIFSGGGLPSEASVARDIAVKLGVPPEACLLEENSHSTFENAQLTAPLLQQRKIDEVVLVTDGYHLLRSTLQFSNAGIRTQAVASERALASSDYAYWTVREAIALLRRPAMLWR